MNTRTAQHKDWIRTKSKRRTYCVRCLRQDDSVDYDYVYGVQIDVYDMTRL